MMRPRFFAPSLDLERREAVLPDDESRHLVRVLRLKPGAAVEVFDGSGREFVAEVVAASRDRATLTLKEPIVRARAPRLRITLAQGVLKQMDDVVRDATMMEVDAIVPLLTDHGAVAPRMVGEGRAVERWKRIALASAKQCRRASLPQISRPLSFDEWLAGVEGRATLLLVEPSASADARTARSLLEDPVPDSPTIAVGPEGGWSPREIAAAAEAGCTLVTLGGMTLRADAAALVALGALSVIWSG
jgi:16S rRNA (uracil1498-N3)-methyltransferase